MKRMNTILVVMVLVTIGTMTVTGQVPAKPGTGFLSGLNMFRLIVEGERDPQFDSVIFGDNASISVSIWLPSVFEWDSTDVKSDVDLKANEPFWRYEPAPKNNDNRLSELRKQLEPDRQSVKEYREIGNNHFCEYQDLL